MSSVKHLLEHGARITERSDDGKTALLYAGRSGRLEDRHM
jgi:ankyrin repeat protein